jgi:hypothetical protein
MTSKSLSRNAFLIPEEDAPKAANSDDSRVKHVNVYEAVAGRNFILIRTYARCLRLSGRISSQGFIPRQPIYASTRDTASSSTTAVPPQDILYKRYNAPPRYAESDVYFANEKKDNLDLPDSDLLKAVHAYTSDFYSRAVKDLKYDFKSMDETALLAFGILLEEASREVLGRTGDLVFTEGEEITADLRSESAALETSPRKAKRRKLREG